MTRTDILEHLVTLFSLDELALLFGVLRRQPVRWWDARTIPARHVAEAARIVAYCRRMGMMPEVVPWLVVARHRGGNRRLLVRARDIDGAERVARRMLPPCRRDAVLEADLAVGVR